MHSDDERNMADDEDEDPVVAEVCLYRGSKVNQPVYSGNSLIRHRSF